MTNDKWTDRLSEYVDGELSDNERDALELHLESCERCAEVLADLEAVVSRAGSLDDRPPARDLWSGVAERIGSTTGAVRAIESAPSLGRSLTRRLSFSVPQLAAAAVTLAVLSGGAAVGWMQLRPDNVALTNPGATGFTPVQNAANVGGPRYDAAVNELEDALEANRGQLDTATVRIIEENLVIIDRAIEQARQALAADPGSVYLSSHLAATLKRKLELLRRATTITTVQS